MGGHHEQAELMAELITMPEPTRYTEYMDVLVHVSRSSVHVSCSSAGAPRCYFPCDISVAAEGRELSPR